MRRPVSPRPIAALSIVLLLAAAAPLAAQEKKKKPERERTEVKRAPPRKPAPAPRPAPAPKPMARPTPSTQGVDRMRAPARPPEVDRDRRITSEPRFARPEAASRIGSPSGPGAAGSVEPGGTAGSGSVSATIDRIIADPDAPQSVQLLHEGTSAAERARVIMEIQQLLRLRTDEPEEGEDKVAPPELDPEAPRVPAAEDAAFELRGPASEPHTEEPSSYDPPTGGTSGIFWLPDFRSTLYDCSPGFLYGPRSLYVRRYGWPSTRWERDLWRNVSLYGASSPFGASSAYGPSGCIDYGPEWTWSQYVGFLDRDDEQPVDCARVTVHRFDGAAASFEVALPALGADTLEELREAIAERLAHGEPVELTVTLRPEDVEDFSVEPCEDDGDRSER